MSDGGERWGRRGSWVGIFLWGSGPAPFRGGRKTSRAGIAGNRDLVPARPSTGQASFLEAYRSGQDLLTVHGRGAPGQAQGRCPTFLGAAMTEEPLSLTPATDQHFQLPLQQRAGLPASRVHSADLWASGGVSSYQPFELKGPLYLSTKFHQALARPAQGQPGVADGGRVLSNWPRLVVWQGVTLAGKWSAVGSG